jgi:polysaccharide export outer membrane protein
MEQYQADWLCFCAMCLKLDSMLENQSNAQVRNDLSGNRASRLLKRRGNVMEHRFGLLCALLILSGTFALPAQQADSAQTTGMPSTSSQAAPHTTPELKQNPLETLRNFEPAKDEEYRIGKGDEMTIDFAGRPEMQAKVVVGPDGRITLPLAGDITIADLTRGEAAKAIDAALSKYYANLVAQVTITKYTANRVVLVGAVDHPGVYTFDGTPTLLELMARGGVEAGPNRSGQIPEVNQIPERCAIYRGSDQVVWVQLRKLMEQGNTLADLRLRRDDVVYVPSVSERFVSVLGEVQHPGAIPLAYNSTVASLLAQAGGLTDHAGNNAHVQVVDTTSGKSRVLTLKQLIDPTKSLEVTLHPGDIIYVPKSGFYRGTYILERFNPLVTVASIALYAGVL